LDAGHALHKPMVEIRNAPMAVSVSARGRKI
jgi:hypothetical protein